MYLTIKKPRIYCIICLVVFFVDYEFVLASTSTKEGLFVSLPSTGKISATFHPQENIEKGQLTRVSFGVPFPKNVLKNVNKIRVILNNKEIPSFSMETTRWHSHNVDSSKFIRSVLVYTDIEFSSSDPVNFLILYGDNRKRTLDASITKPRKEWVSIIGHTYPDEFPSNEKITEPKVYVTFSADWLGLCLLKTRTLPISKKGLWYFFDRASLSFAETAVNDRFAKIKEKETEKINYSSEYEPWLFDRSSTLYSLYIRTGDVRWLRHAHRSTQFYANHIDEKGYFDLKEYQDLKYSYGQSMLIDLILMGDLSYIPTIERVASAGATWHESYSKSLNFWTERHQSYALLAAISAWEATGKKKHADRAKKLVDNMVYITKNPANNWQYNGCLLHTLSQHEGSVHQDPVCSPWMSALLSDATWKYYLISEDENALEFIAGLASYVVNYGVYKGTGSRFSRTILPWYLASSVKTFTDAGQFSDIEHTCDVAGLVVRGLWAAKKLGRETKNTLKTAEDLLNSCINKNLRSKLRLSGAKRLFPPRKFNWWFGTNSDASWLMQEFEN
ncbi:MAG: hypothetical protein L3J59_01965 [Methylococcaceae bacterium]|nr:hypothetical protein [Methylococcaceae bacterium]